MVSGPGTVHMVPAFYSRLAVRVVLYLGHCSPSTRTRSSTNDVVLRHMILFRRTKDVLDDDHVHVDPQPSGNFWQGIEACAAAVNVSRSTVQSLRILSGGDAR